MLYIADAIHDVKRLEELRALPLERKIQITQTRIIEWYQHYHGNVCVSFSGGKDSTVLLHIARKLYPKIPAVFSNTGLEYPEIQQFVKSWDNVDIVVPQMRFDEVISTYGYPLIGKEVAEAIYYARRIRPSGERERGLEEAQRTPRSTAERKQGELLGYRPTGRGWNWWGGRTEGERRSAVRSRQTRTSTESAEPGVVKPSGNVQKSQKDTETAEKPG